jgi:hypothetical protein
VTILATGAPRSAKACRPRPRAACLRQHDLDQARRFTDPGTHEQLRKSPLVLLTPTRPPPAPGQGAPRCAHPRPAGGVCPDTRWADGEAPRPRLTSPFVRARRIHPSSASLIVPLRPSRRLSLRAGAVSPGRDEQLPREPRQPLINLHSLGLVGWQGLLLAG